jgi:hypothetical protein
MNQNGRKGYVYILVNPAFSGFVKVGKTTKEPETRARELSSGSGVPAPYAVAWDAFVTDCDHVECLVHRELAHARTRKDREFFSISLKNAISIASKIVGPFSCEVGELPLEAARLPEPDAEPKIPKVGPVTFRRSGAKPEELIEVAEDCEAERAMEPPDGGLNKTIQRIAYEVLIENPYTYSEMELFHEVHVVRRNRSDLKLESYNIKRHPLVQRFGWGIHRNKEGKLALVAVDSKKYRELQQSIKTTKAYRRSKV